MNKLGIFGAVTLLSIAAAVPAMARSHHHHHHHHARAHSHHAFDIYSHNYGPAVLPGEAFAYYDGPLSVRCRQSAAAYRGQDGRPHPCN